MLRKRRLVAHFGFGLLATCWIFNTMNAYRHICGGDRISHRAWVAGIES